VETKKGKILIIDGDKEFRQKVGFFLREKGYIVEDSFSFSFALEALSTSLFDCVILNVKLPDVDGCEAVSALREISSKSRLILVADLNIKEIERRVVDKKVCFYYIKTFPLNELLHAVEELLEKSRQITGIGYVARIHQGSGAGKIVTCGEQENMIKKFCDEEGIELLEIIKENDCSLPCLERPGIKSLFQKVGGVDFVIVERPWCIGRRASVLNQILSLLKTYNVRLLCASFLWDAASQYVRRYYCNSARKILEEVKGKR